MTPSNVTPYYRDTEILICSLPNLLIDPPMSPVPSLLQPFVFPLSLIPSIPLYFLFILSFFISFSHFSIFFLYILSLPYLFNFSLFPLCFTFLPIHLSYFSVFIIFAISYYMYYLYSLFTLFIFISFPSRLSDNLLLLLFIFFFYYFIFPFFVPSVIYLVSLYIYINYFPSFHFLFIIFTLI